MDVVSRQVLTQLKLRQIEHGRIIKELEQARVEVASEKARAEQLLDNVLPASVAEELKRKGKVEPKCTDFATILFADFQGFTLLAEQLEPALLVDLLDEIFHRVRRHHCPIWGGKGQDDWRCVHGRWRRVRNRSPASRQRLSRSAPNERESCRDQVAAKG